MRIFQPGDWQRPRGFFHGVEFSANGQWIVFAGQTGSDANGIYENGNLAGQVRVALGRVVRLLREAGAGPEHIVRLPGI
jgi:enamine deaminase RidA (YjgF/YER057c/UK114 family)